MTTTVASPSLAAVFFTFQKSGWLSVYRCVCTCVLPAAQPAPASAERVATTRTRSQQQPSIERPFMTCLLHSAEELPLLVRAPLQHEPVHVAHAPVPLAVLRRQLERPVEVG